MRRAGRRPRWRRDATSGFWSAYHLVHSSGSAWRRRWTAWGQGVRPHADSGSKGVVRSVSVGRLERPHAHHELALRSAGRGTRLLARSRCSLRCWADSASMRRPAMHSVGRGPPHWPSRRAHGGHRTLISMTWFCRSPRTQPPGPRAFSPPVLSGLLSPRPLAILAALLRPRPHQRGTLAASLHGGAGFFVWGGFPGAAGGGEGVSGVGWALSGLVLALGSPGLPWAAILRPSWTAPHFCCVVWCGPRGPSAPQWGAAGCTTRVFHVSQVGFD